MLSTASPALKPSEQLFSSEAILNPYLGLRNGRLVAFPWLDIELMAPKEGLGRVGLSLEPFLRAYPWLILEG